MFDKIKELLNQTIKVSPTVKKIIDIGSAPTKFIAEKKEPIKSFVTNTAVEAGKTTRKFGDMLSAPIQYQSKTKELEANTKALNVSFDQWKKTNKPEYLSEAKKYAGLSKINLQEMREFEKYTPKEIGKTSLQFTGNTISNLLSANAFNFKSPAITNHIKAGLTKLQPVTSKFSTVGNTVAKQFGTMNLFDLSGGDHIANQLAKTKTGQDFIKWASGNDFGTNTSLTIKALLRGETKEEAKRKYESYIQSPDTSLFGKIVAQAPSSVLDTALPILTGIATGVITKNPRLASAVSSTMFAGQSAKGTLQANQQIKLSNLYIDVALDSVLGDTVESILKTAGKNLAVTGIKKTVINLGKGAFVEGTTEVGQSILKTANDYRLAQNDSQRQEVVNDFKEYLASGGIIEEFALGAIGGGVIAGSASAYKSMSQSKIKNKLVEAGQIAIGKALTRKQKGFIDLKNIATGGKISVGELANNFDNVNNQSYDNQSKSISEFVQKIQKPTKNLITDSGQNSKTQQQYGLLKSIGSGNDNIGDRPSDTDNAGRIRQYLDHKYKNDFERNQAIEKFVKQELDRTDITPEVRDFLASYSGAGGKAKQGATGKGLLSEYYTPRPVVKKMWDIVSKYVPTTNAKVLEPSVGVGVFLDEAPQGIQADAIEMNPITAQITQALHPNTKVVTGQFEEMFIDKANSRPVDKVDKTYDIVIGNPPYGKYSGRYKGMGEGKGIQKTEEYFIKRGLDVLRDNGILAYIVPSSFLRTAPNQAKNQIAQQATLVDAIRLPEKVFGGTTIGTDILIFRKGAGMNPNVLSNNTYFNQTDKPVLGVEKTRTNKYGKEEQYIEMARDLFESELAKIQTQENIIETIIEDNQALTNVQAPQPKKTFKKANIIEATTEKYQIFNENVDLSDRDLWEATLVDGTLPNSYLRDPRTNYYKTEVYNDFNYLQGNIYEKLDQLEIEKEVAPNYEMQKEKLLAVLPTPKEVDQIFWNPTSAFIKKIKGDTVIREKWNSSKGKMEEVFEDPIFQFKEWVSYLTPTERNDFPTNHIIQHIWGNRISLNTYGMDKKQAERAKIEYLTNLKNTTEKLFQKFVEQELSEDLRNKLVTQWNRNFNAIYSPDYSKQPLKVEKMKATFHGKPFNPYGVQIEAVNFLVNEGKGLLGASMLMSKDEAEAMIDKNRTVKLEPEEIDRVAPLVIEAYWKKIQQEVKQGKPVILGGDDLKDYFGNDYNDLNHPIYSKATFQLYEKALKEFSATTVYLTGGGASSGKTDFVVNQIAQNDPVSIIYDSNLSSIPGAINQIQLAKKYGKDVKIYGIIPDLFTARKYSILRERKIGRGISDTTFARGHWGFPNTIVNLIEDKIIPESDVKILDTRNLQTPQEIYQVFANDDFMENVFDELSNLGYNEDNIKQEYAKERIIAILEREQEAISKKTVRDVSGGRTDTTSVGGGVERLRGTISSPQSQKDLVSDSLLSGGTSLLPVKYTDFQLEGEPIEKGFVYTPNPLATDKKVDYLTQKKAHYQYEMYRDQYMAPENDMVTYDENGNITQVIFNTDEWRHFFGEYTGYNSNDTHIANSKMNGRFFREMLPQMVGKGDGTFIYVGGGAGSGKSSAEALYELSPAILDTSLGGNPEKLAQQMDMLSDMGYKPKIIFVDRNPYEAFVNGVIPRATKNLNSQDRKAKPRTVLVEFALNGNISARNNLIWLMTNRPQYEFVLVDNNYGFRNQKVIKDPKEILDIAKKRLEEYTRDKEKISTQIYEEVQRQYIQGEIPAEIYQGLVGTGSTPRKNLAVQLLPSGGYDGRYDRGRNSTQKVSGRELAIITSTIGESNTNEQESSRFALSREFYELVQLIKQANSFDDIKELFTPQGFAQNPYLKNPNRNQIRIDLGVLGITKLDQLYDSIKNNDIQQTQPVESVEQLSIQEIIQIALSQDSYSAFKKTIDEYTNYGADVDLELGIQKYLENQDYRSYYQENRLLQNMTSVKEVQHNVTVLLNRAFGSAQKEMQDVWQDVWQDLMLELENSEAGYRQGAIDQTTGERFTISASSTFPKWLQPDNRSHKLLDKVLPELQIEGGKIKNTKREQSVVLDILAELFKRTNENPSQDYLVAQELFSYSQDYVNKPLPETIKSKTGIQLDEVFADDPDDPKVKQDKVLNDVAKGIAKGKKLSSKGWDQLKDIIEKRKEAEKIAKEDAKILSLKPEVQAVKENERLRYFWDNAMRFQDSIALLNYFFGSQAGKGESTYDTVEALASDLRKAGFVDIEDFYKKAILADLDRIKIPQNILNRSSAEVYLYIQRIRRRERINPFSKQGRLNAEENFKAYIETVYTDDPDIPLIDGESYRQMHATVDSLDGENAIKDISGVAGQMRDVYRNFDKVFRNTPQAEQVQDFLINPLNQSKKDFIFDLDKEVNEVYQYIVKELGIQKGSELSAFVQMYGEAKIKDIEIVEKYGNEGLEKIQKADTFFRNKYDELIDRVNEVRARIYPHNAGKIVPKREDYYRHYREMGRDFAGLYEILTGVHSIDPHLTGISQDTKPKSKWASFMQRRKGDKSTLDAVGGFLDYIPSAMYSIHIDVNIGRFRSFHSLLADKAEAEELSLNFFLEYLIDFANDLAGKTNTLDRYAKKVVGRKAFAVLDWLTNRIKANMILLNLRSSLMQVFNLPQGISETPLYIINGMTQTIFESQTEPKNSPIDESAFIKERYGYQMFDRFDTNVIVKAKHFAEWMTGVLDEFSSRAIWYANYKKAKEQGIQNPVGYADNVTRRMVGGRGIGEKPLIQKSKLFQFVAPFQLEVGNLWWVMQDRADRKEIGKLAGLLIMAYFFNAIAEKVTGSGGMFDPIKALFDGAKEWEEEDDKKLAGAKFVGRQIGEVLSNITFGATLAELFPDKFTLWGKDITKEELFGEGDPGRFEGGLLITKLRNPYNWLPFGGRQLEKTVKTITDPESPKTLQTLLFGKWSDSQIQEEQVRKNAIYNRLQQQTREREFSQTSFQTTFENLQKMDPATRNQEIQKLQNQDSGFKKKLEEHIKEEKKGLTKEDRMVKALGVENKERAEYFYEVANDFGSQEEYKLYLKEQMRKGNLSPTILKQWAEMYQNKPLF